MKSTLKIVVCLGFICSTFSCGTLPVEAYVEVNCPRTETKSSYNENNNDNTPETESRALKTLKKSATMASQNDRPESELMLSYRVGVGTDVPINDKLTKQRRDYQHPAIRYIWQITRNPKTRLLYLQNQYITKYKRWNLLIKDK